MLNLILFGYTIDIISIRSDGKITTMAASVFNISNESKGGEKWWIFALWALVTVTFVEFSITLIADQELYNIHGDDRHLIWVVVAFAIYAGILFFFVKIYVEAMGDTTIDFKNGILIHKRQTSLFSNTKRFFLNKIKNPRLLDLGENNFQVGFNFGPKNRLVVLGQFNNEEKAKQMLSWLRTNIHAHLI